MNAELCRDLIQLLRQAESDPTVGSILLCGNGRSFCAGMDLAEIVDSNTAEINQLHEELFTIGRSLAKPLIAAVQGAALGGGTGLVANCHAVIAAPDASFGLTEIRLGLWPFLVYRAVVAALGERRTLELALSGRIIDGNEAFTVGLAHQVHRDYEARALALAESVAAHSPTAIQTGLRFVQEVNGKDWETAGVIARRVRDQVFASPDFREGVQAFREKRSARWPSLQS